VDAGAVVFRTVDAVAEVAVFLTARDAAWARGTAGFFAVVVDPAVAFLVPVPVRVGFATVVPEDVVEEKLFLRSPWRVAGRGRGDLTERGPVAERAVVFFACVDIWLSLTVEMVVPRGREPGAAARRGLEGLSGEVGRDMYDGCPFSGEARNGDCG
jgi:hypothetical protein